MRVVIVIYTLLFLLPVLLHGQRVDSYTVDDGLPQGFIGSLIQDQQGYIWAATLNGLSRFDGVEFRNYFADINDPYALKSSRILKLEISNGTFWVITDAGLQVYDSVTDRFYTPSINSSSSKIQWHHVYFDKNNQIWCNSLDSVFCYAIKRMGDVAIHLEKIPQNTWVRPPSLFSRIVTVFKTDTSLLVCTEKGGAVITDKDKRFQWIPELQFMGLSELLYDNQSAGYWVKTADNLFLWDGSTSLKKMPIGLESDHLDISMCFTPQMTYISNGKELFTWDGQVCKRLESALSDHIISMCSDWSGNLWLGTSSKGLRMINFNHPDFKTFKEGSYINQKVVFTPEGRWLYPEKVYNDSKNTCLNYTSIDEEGQNNTIICKALDYDKMGNKWMIDCDGRIIVEHKLTGKKKYYDIPSTPRQNYDQLYTLKCSADGNTYIITGSKYLICLQPATGVTLTYDLLGLTAETVATLRINEWLVHNNQVFVAMSNGVVRVNFDIDNQKVTDDFLSNNGKDTYSIRPSDVSSISVDALEHTIIWIGTSSGLYKWNYQKKEIISVQVKDLRSTDYIFCLMSSPAGSLWLGTQRGLIEYYPQTGFSRGYSKNDGLPESEFNHNTAVLAPDGSIFMGTVGGLLRFYPEKMSYTSTSSKVVITGVYLQNERIHALGKDWLLPEFQYFENDLSISYALMDLTNPSTHTFRYRINGGDWINAYNQTKVLLVGLKPDKYTFEVQGSDGKSEWSPSVILKFTILAPWWQTWYAYFFYLLLFIGVGMWFVFFRIRLEKMKSELLIKSKENELEEMRIQLLSNITHEVRTPLTVVLGIADQLRKSLRGKELEQVSLLSRGAQEIRLLSDQILDLSGGIEKNSYFQPTAINLKLLLLEITDYFQFWSKSKGLVFEVESPETVVWAQLDERAVKSILNNLLSNAFKFTPAGGKVVLNFTVPNETTLSFMITDNGMGMSESEVQKIFERFYQATNSRKYGGNGIGLSYVKEIVEKMNGSVQVLSEKGKGSQFSILLPWTHVEFPLNTELEDQPNIHVLSDIVVEAGEDQQREDWPQVLIVEDNPYVAHYIKNCIREEYITLYTSDGVSGFEAAVEQLPDIIITDVMMPGIDGKALTLKIREHPLTCHIPIIMLTALIEKEDQLEGLRSGATAYMAKPFLQEELLLMLKNILLLRKSHQLTSFPVVEKEAENALDSTVPQLDVLFWEKLMLLIEQNFMNSDFGVREMEKEMNMSKTQFHRKVTAISGHSAGYFLRQKRLEEATRLLKARVDLTISEIGYQCGFSDPAYFSTAFSSQYGMSPKSFRVSKKDI